MTEWDAAMSRSVAFELEHPDPVYGMRYAWRRIYQWLLRCGPCDPRIAEMEAEYCTGG